MAKSSPASAPAEPTEMQWSTGVMDCCEDSAICCYTALFPACSFGQNVQRVDPDAVPCGGTCLGGTGVYCALLACGLHGLYHSHVRRHIRSKYGLKGTTGQDLLYAYCCGPCATCQESRELRKRAIGPCGVHLKSRTSSRCDALEVSASSAATIPGYRPAASARSGKLSTKPSKLDIAASCNSASMPPGSTVASPAARSGNSTTTRKVEFLDTAGSTTSTVAGAGSVLTSPMARGAPGARKADDLEASASSVVHLPPAPCKQSSSRSAASDCQALYAYNGAANARGAKAAAPSAASSWRSSLTVTPSASINDHNAAYSALPSPGAAQGARDRAFAVSVFANSRSINSSVNSTSTVHNAAAGALADATARSPRVTGNGGQQQGHVPTLPSPRAAGSGQQPGYSPGASLFRTTASGQQAYGTAARSPRVSGHGHQGFMPAAPVFRTAGSGQAAADAADAVRGRSEFRSEPALQPPQAQQVQQVQQPPQQAQQVQLAQHAQPQGSGSQNVPSYFRDLQRMRSPPAPLQLSGHLSAHVE